MTPLPPSVRQDGAPPGEHWTARHGKPIIFVILALVAVGIFLALNIPIAVFPDTDFPRVVIGVAVRNEGRTAAHERFGVFAVGPVPSLRVIAVKRDRAGHRLSHLHRDRPR